MLPAVGELKAGELPLLPLLPLFPLLALPIELGLKGIDEELCASGEKAELASFLLLLILPLVSSRYGEAAGLFGDTTVERGDPVVDEVVVEVVVEVLVEVGLKNANG
jgi:hypothetical protein